MKNFLLQNKRLYLILITLVLLVILLFFPIKLMLVFEYQNTGKVIAYLPLKKKDSFKLKYTHSIHLSHVIESYHITKHQQMELFELMYEDFAIGMPENSSVGEIFEEKEGKYFIKNMKRTLPSFDLRTGKLKANHTIIYKGKEYPLKNSIAPGTWVRIQVKRINWIQVMKGVDILESN